ncbi:TPA: hypothetical protein N0F65_008392 [Lagenidium giganteum]|uniref:Guanine nucleotide-binding protein subunit beta-like protein n=1 Tax=Lagenidium giganteum TaxID=4803 RepID=A0AAV2Z135_9STRA|nr:TPA: hypothetical protein N0F65_008392 [Lagenidium giganteum]
MSRRNVRFEEYAASGMVEVTDVGDRLSHIKIKASNDVQPGAQLAPQSRSAMPRNAASQSHRRNDQYMEEFDSGFEELSRNARAKEPSDGKTSSSSAKMAKENSSARVVGVKESTVRAEVELAEQSMGSGAFGGAWLTGPKVAEGTVHDVSAQPLMCMSMSRDQKEIVVGSCDHALYVIPLSATKNARPKTLYTKKYGHAEWITSVTYLREDNRILSGGMDSKLCLWDSTGVKCEDLVGHAGSISLVKALGDGLALSASYDKTIRIWNVGKKASSREREVSTIKAGTAAVMDASTVETSATVVTGDRDGCVHLVDLDQAKILRKHPSAHKGQVTSVLGSQQPQDDQQRSLFYTGGQDGIVRVWDTRQKAVVETLELHIDARSGKRGAVGFLRDPAGENVLVTGGADGTVKVLDKRASFGVLHNFTEHMDFIYSLHVAGQLCFSGAGNGMLHVHDWKQGKLFYGLGANKAAVRAIDTTADKLVAAGDDGSVIMYDMV